MKRSLMIASLFLGLPLLGMAQSTHSHPSPRQPQAAPHSKASSTPANRQAAGWAFSSQTRIHARLKSRLDTRHAHVGDQVRAQTTSQVKSHGRVVLPKGSRLFGQVTQVKKAANRQAGSSVGVLFTEAVTRHGRRIPIHASITQVMMASSQMQAGFNPPPMPQPMAAGAGGAMTAGGGLMGGIGGSLGGAVNSTAQMAGNAGAGLDAPAAGMGGGLLRASNGAGFRVLPIEAAGGSQSSLLVAPHGNLVLNSGTQMLLTAGPASASATSSTSTQIRH